jgi:hypothetical protein
MRASRMTAARLPCDWASARLACGAAGNQPGLVVTGLESALRSRSSLGVDWGGDSWLVRFFQPRWTRAAAAVWAAVGSGRFLDGRRQRTTARAMSHRHQVM